MSLSTPQRRRSSEPVEGTAKRGRRWPRRLRGFPAFLAVAVVALVVLLPLALTRPTDGAPTRPYVPPAMPAQAAPLPMTAFVGDSYTAAGASNGMSADGSMTDLLGKRFGWQVANNAVGSTGYVATRPGRGTFAQEQSAPTVATGASLVIVAGSRNDVGLPGVREAASALYGELRAKLPTARLVVVGPSWTGPVTPKVTATRDEVRDAARDAGLLFIDPIAEAWFADPTLISPDGVHPNAAGQVEMARRLGDDLERAGVARPLPGTGR